MSSTPETSNSSSSATTTNHLDHSVASTSLVAVQSMNDNQSIASSSIDNTPNMTNKAPPVKQISNAKKHFNNVLSTSAKRIQKELAEITLDPPPNCTAGPKGINVYLFTL